VCEHPRNQVRTAHSLCCAARREEGPAPLVAPPYRTAPRECEKGTCVAGAGIDIDIFAPMHDLYKTKRGIVEIGDDIPDWLDGLAYATFDRYAVDDIRLGGGSFGDTRTNERISAVRSEDSDAIHIALSTSNATGDGWRLMGSPDDADFTLLVALEAVSQYDYWLYERDAQPGEWYRLPEYDAMVEQPAFVFGEPDNLTFANPMPLPSGSIVFDSDLVGNPNMCIVPGAPRALLSKLLHFTVQSRVPADAC
jgi:hypothetical protein